jgi:hypothetical protein
VQLEQRAQSLARLAQLVLLATQALLVQQALHQQLLVLLEQLEPQEQRAQSLARLAHRVSQDQPVHRVSQDLPVQLVQPQQSQVQLDRKELRAQLVQLVQREQASQFLANTPTLQRCKQLTQLVIQATGT